MSIERVSLVSSTDPDSFSNGVIDAGSGTLNVLYTNYPGDKVYASQRPGIKITTNAADASKPATQGRGITYWDLVDSFYFVREGDVYRDDYSNFIGAIGGAGDRDRVYFAEVGNYLCIIDPERNKGWTINVSTPNTLVEITDVDFPPKQTPALQLAGGAVSLDGYLFVMATNGTIWNCNLNLPTTWTALDFIGADIEPDGGVMIAKHHNHIAAIGTSSVQFFYDAGNPVGSPLQLRQDVFYQTGAVEHNAVGISGENITFLGREAGGTVGLYSMENFKVTKASIDNIDRYLGHTYSTQSVDNDYMKFIVSSAWFGEHLLSFITAVGINETSGDPDYKPKYTLVYDTSSKLWGRFSSELSLIEEFAVMDATEATGSIGVKGSLMFLSGSIGVVDLSGSTADYKNTEEYILYEASIDGPAGYSTDTFWTDGYIVSAPDSAFNNIPLEIVTLETDFDTLTYKNVHRMAVVGTTTASAGDLTPLKVSWSDDRYRSFSNERDLDSGLRRSLTRAGNFKRRAHKIGYSGADLLRIESLEFDIRASEYA